MRKKEYLEQLSQKYGDGFYLVSKERINSAYSHFYRAFQHRYSNFKIAYSFKTCFVNALLKQLLECGAWAEVTSEYEYTLAGKIGFRDDQIVYNGPYKVPELMLKIASNGGVVNLDSIYEAKQLCEVANGKPISVGIRCNFDVDGRLSRFGIDMESTEFDDVIHMLKEHRIKVNGFMCHIKTRTLADWRKKAERLVSYVITVVTQWNLKEISFIDIGGGYNFDFDMFDEYAQIVTEQIKRMNDENIMLITEPGAAIAESSMDYIAKTVNTNVIRNHKFVVIAATISDVSAIRKRPPGKVYIISKKNSNSASKYSKISVTGFTCLEDDIIIDDLKKDADVGDYIVFENVGAYASSLRPDFIRGCPAILIEDEGNRVAVDRFQASIDCMNKHDRCE